MELQQNNWKILTLIPDAENIADYTDTESKNTDAGCDCDQKLYSIQYSRYSRTPLYSLVYHDF